MIRADRVIIGDQERSACLVLRDEHVVDVIDHADTGASEVVEYGPAMVVMPGLVDTHVHVNEPGRTEWEGFACATAAAAAGGVTTIVDMPLNSIPATVDPAALEVKRRATHGKLAIDVAFWGGAVPGNLDQLAALHAAGVVGFKSFLLPSGVDEFPPLSSAELGKAMQVIAGLGALLIAHAEDPAVIDAAPSKAGHSYADFVASRPDAAEHRAVVELIAASRRTGCRIHVVHVSSAGTVPLIRAAKSEGIPITAETCPHYLDLVAEAVPDGATQYKCCPPIRSQSNREALWAALADGTIDCIVSDHSPCTPDLKRLDTGDFAEAWGGISSLQLALPIVWTQARARGIGLEHLARWMAQSPAELVSLPDRGVIAPGRRAHLCVLEPDANFTVDFRALRHRNPLTPYEGRTLFGVVRDTWLDGTIIDDERPSGRMVRSW